MKSLVRTKKKLRTIGIDLGTTNCSVAEVIWEEGCVGQPEAKCLEVGQPTESGPYTHVLIPSYVALSGGREWVGEGAKQLRALSGERGLEQNLNLFYECKNDMGVLRSYHRAPEGYKSAKEIAGRVLKFLLDEVLSQGTPPDHVVVTVPASFQAAQRTDTLEACQLAGISIEGGDLLDEPLAAFLDYIVSHREEISFQAGTPANLLIFDFGGGTCDVAVLRVGLAADRRGLEVAPLAVSRYHRLGGGDIDSAILYDVLMPQIFDQNDLAPFDIGYEDKKRYIEPAFIGVAEALKIGLCREIVRIRAFGKYAEADREKIIKTVPGLHSCTLPDGRSLKLIGPALTAHQFETLLEPFLDRQLLYARETEYRLTCSIFAPLQDSLDRAHLSPKDIQYSLCTGGSCLIPQVIDALRDYFQNGNVLASREEEDMQTMVARGAAYHALAIASEGKGLIRAICHDTIAIQTQDGLIDLVATGAELPYPSDGTFRVAHGLSLPQTVLTGVLDLRVEILAKDEHRVLMAGLWKIPAPVNKGDPLTLRYRYDANQVLFFELCLSEKEDAEPFEAKIQNPLTNVVNPSKTRLKIDEMEEDLRTGRYKGDQQITKLVELADLYSEIRQNEKALGILAKVLRVRNQPDAEVLNKMAGCCAEMGDDSGAEKFYREAAKASSWSGSWFNLALLFQRKGRLTEAVECVERAIAEDGKAPYRVLRAQLHEKMGEIAKRDTELAEAFATFGPITSLNDWELGWYQAAAMMGGQKEKAEEAISEIRRRKVEQAPEQVGGELPQGPRAIQAVEGW